MCNLKCTFCPNKDIDKKYHGFMDLDLFSSIVRQAAEMGVFDVRLFLRGEPLLHKNISRMIRISKEKGVKTELHTNAMLLNRDRSKELIDASLDLISFSLDGVNKRSYLRHRIGGNLGRVIDNISQFLRYKKGSKAINPWVKIQLIMYSEENDPQKMQTKTNELFYGLPVDEITVIRAHGWGGKFTALDSGISKKRICGDVYHALSIYWDGTVVPCCLDFFAEYRLGNVKDEKLVDIWHGSKLAHLRRTLLGNKNDKIRLCRNCDMLYQNDLFGIPRNMLGMGRSIVGRNQLISFIENKIREIKLLN